MEKQKVFIPVSVEKEPDWQSNYYLGVSPNGRFNEFSSSEELKDIDISYWLKEQEGYFFTPEELIEMRKKDYLNGFQQRSVYLDKIQTPEQYIESLNIK